jgi:choice-of-anchor B domain-containing protein
MRSPRLTVLLLCAAACLPSTARAQAGASVALVPVQGRATPDLVVLRPSGARGSPAVLVYRLSSDEAWERAGSMPPAAPAAPYEGFTGSLAAGRGIVAAGAADAAGAWAGSVYLHQGNGWSEGARVAWDAASARTSAAASPPEGLDMPLLMGIMQPRSRALALSPDGGTLAMAIQGVGEVRVVRRSGGGAGWEPDGTLTVEDSMGFAGPVVLAADADRVYVGAPRRRGTGTVLVFARDAAGAWALEDELAPDAPDVRAFGVALSVDDPVVAVGAPESGQVFTFRRTRDGWTAEPPLTSPDGGTDGAFGAAVAASEGELWVGAPLAAGRAGEVHRFALESDGGWRHADVIAGGTGQGSAFGAAVDVRGDLAAVGAPGANRGGGAAAVYTRADGRWTGPIWVGGLDVPAAVVGERVSCREGRAGPFHCDDVDLLAYLPLDALHAGPGERVSDTWGWADPETGREYALVGRTAGMVIVDVTAPSEPRYVGIVPANPSGARDIKTFADHAFFTGDGAGDHGLVVFDLARLRDVPDTAVTFEPDARYEGITSAHNLIMDDESGIAIPVGASGGGETCGGGLHMIDVSTPSEPSFLGCYTDDIGLIAPGRSHDGQCVVYRGPDDRYDGHNICFASNETALRILDITRPDSVQEVGLGRYPGTAYTHQGWLTEDHRYFYMNDEADELVGLTDRTRTLIWDVSELDDPVLVGEHLGPDNATDHNLYIRGDRMYQANYQAGFRVVDISDPENPSDLGTFDTTPYDGNPPGFQTGAWTAYPFLPSGTVVVTSMNEGLFLLRPRTVVP